MINQLAQPSAGANIRQVIIDFAADAIITSENGKVATESLSRNPHWAKVDEVIAFYERQGYTRTVEEAGRVVYEKPLFGRKPRHKVDPMPGCRECGAERFENSAYCKTHYLEHHKKYARKSNARKNPCQHEGADGHPCTEPRVPWKRFCAVHLDQAIAAKIDSKLARQPRTVKRVTAAPVPVKALHSAYGSRWCSSCSHALPASDFDTSKDSAFGILNFICRKCEAQPVKV